jgi:hypothetical protein
MNRATDSTDLIRPCSILFLCLLVSHEFQFVLGMLQYIQARLSAPANIESAQKILHLQVTDASVGLYMNLHCGHNNPFSKDERKTLKALLERSTTGGASG